MSKLRFGVTRIVAKVQEDSARYKEQLLMDTFMEAYTILRYACPTGDLRIHLSVVVDDVNTLPGIVKP